MRMRFGKPYLGLGLLLAGGVTYAGLRAFEVGAAQERPGATAAPTPAPEVSVAEVVVRTIAPTSEWSGTLRAFDRVEIRSRIAGRIDEVLVPEGGLVRRGQLLFRLDPRPQRASLASARAALTRAESHRTLATGEFERARRLQESAVIADDELESRTASRSDADATVAMARAEVRARALELGYTRITAPIDGRVGESRVEVGSLVSGGNDAATLLTQIVSIDPLHVVFDVDEPTHRALSRADRSQAPIAIAVALADEATYARTAELDYLDPEVDATSGTARVRAVLHDPDGSLRPGQFVRVRLPIDSARETVLIADASVHADASGRFVLVVSSTGIVEVRPITLGGLVDGMRVVTRGLSPGDRVLVAGMARPGMRVRSRTVPMIPELAASLANGGGR